MSVIGKSTGDYDLKKKVRMSDMSVKAITNAMHEYINGKLNDSPETEEEKNRYLNNEKQDQQKNNRINRQNSRKLIVTVAEHRKGQDNMNVPPEKKRRKMRKDGSFCQMLPRQQESKPYNGTRNK